MKDFMDYETTRGYIYATWTALLGAIVGLSIVLVCHLHFTWNPHDWDCSRHGGLPSFSTRCADGYMP